MKDTGYTPRVGDIVRFKKTPFASDKTGEFIGEFAEVIDTDSFSGDTFAFRFTTVSELDDVSFFARPHWVEVLYSKHKE